VLNFTMYGMFGILKDFTIFRQVGDKVELIEGYEKFADALGGPLQPGDRGIVVELQVDPNGEK
jgi:hypothetical protein